MFMPEVTAFCYIFGEKCGLKRLGYTAIAGARNFQFEKAIPSSRESMRIEFMAPEEFKRPADFRVDVQEGIHARACTGGTIALAEADEYPLQGRLPDGQARTAKVRVTRPHALVMLKLLALYDRYHNIRGPAEATHDRAEAQTHAADVVAVVQARPDLAEFKAQFEGQFRSDPELGKRVKPRRSADNPRKMTNPSPMAKDVRRRLQDAEQELASIKEQVQSPTTPEVRRALAERLKRLQEEIQLLRGKLPTSRKSG